MKRLAFVLLIGATLASCAKETAPPETSGSTATTAVESTTVADTSIPATTSEGETALPVTTSGAPTPPTAPAGPTPAPINGKVLETMSAAGYTYVRLQTAGGELWAAVNQPKVDKGTTISITPDIVMENFESKTLNRKFDRIVFGRLAGTSPAGVRGQSPMPGSAPITMPPSAQNPHATAGLVADDSGRINVEAIPGGRRVAELWSERAKLNGATVTVRGKVVKFNPGIMGKNWVHLRDGSGTANEGNNDITITTDAMVGVGEVVTITGVLKIDQDLGAGYTYSVIIVDAKVAK